MFCIQDLLKHFGNLMATKDRELMHYVLFSFKNWHDIIFNFQTWHLFTDEIRNSYLYILQEHIKHAKTTVQYSWRYYITYCKALQTIIDSNFDLNEKQIARINAPNSEKSLISNK